MGYRCYEKNTDSDRDVYAELRYAWEIERSYPENQEETDKFSSYFE